jgi:ABC-type transport system substrate-binding protein
VPFDRALAASLLHGARPQVELLVPSESRTMARIGDVWAADARGLVTIDVVAVPFAELVARLRAGTFQIALTSFTSGPELDLWPQLSSRSRDGDNYAGLADPALDELLDRVRAELDPAARATLRDAIARRIDELQPYAFIAADARVGVARRSIGGLVRGPGAGPPPARMLWKGRGR